MSSNSPAELKFDIGHVLFIDIVGYSKLLLAEQSNQMQTLREIVRGTEQFKKAEAEGKLLRLPTGDGGALVFRNSLEAPVLCALEISKALKSYPELKVRMGIHSGPVNEITDLNEQANIAGVGINMAQRVMDCGDAGHILLSKRVADDLEHYPQWRSHLSDLGECEVKHGTRVSVVNLYTDDAGNCAAPQKFSKQTAAVTPTDSVHRRHSKFSLIAGAALVFATVIAVGWWTNWPHKNVAGNRNAGEGAAGLSTPATPNSQVLGGARPFIPEKSIAVLPFDNLSRDPDNAYFCEGVQDEILTRLAKVADLKVISRTSTQHFKSSPENLPQIAQQLGVANILEGNVQKSNDQVRVNVQLINAQTDAHLWADIYDRKLTDLFAVESEIAKSIADTLQAKLTGSEKAAMSKRPTEDPEAYQLYLKGRFFWNKRTGADLKRAIDYFNQAISKDPNYALAYSGLADSYLLLSVYGADSPRNSIPQAKAAAKKALELDNALPEAHASWGRILAGYDFAFDQAIAEFERAIELNPNYATARHWFSNTALVARGDFDRAIAEGKRSVELDPLSMINHADLGNTYFYARRYDEAVSATRKAIEIEPRSHIAHYDLGEIFQKMGQLDAALDEYKKAVELDDDPQALALLGQAYARAGKRNEAEQILAHLIEEGKTRYVSAYNLALMYLGLGEKEHALDALERAYSEGAGNDIYCIRVDPMLDELRGNPRFEALAEKIVPAREFHASMMTNE
ncbi:MAG TPA: tetratricopeptide repeat protein [Candidatus Udaeobacter sp.]